MPELEDQEPEAAETAPGETDEIEVVAHSDEEDEELNAGCQFNSASQL
ncbi:hypothetical protein KGA66_14430 [Actinocrinis puniceicyclus]|uniref:Uncharacterized protein n=1 Tax=Actinocrinis puniceicyclus TaxID=977794 RepID=A0A8J8BCK1_9ACTN|nr:hypothetical protein [Actinocrinis puniceicyclus]MBS2964253.1 hypothetical protein [Actinocrinis puniceicyclus]